MLPEIRDFDRLTREFRWSIPLRYNIGVDICDKWAATDPSRIAILDVSASGEVTPLTFGEFRTKSEPAGECAAQEGHRSRRPRRAASAAIARTRRGPRRRLQARRGGAAARGAVRGRCAGLPPCGRRRAVPRHQRRRVGENRRNQASDTGAGDGAVRRWPRRRRFGLPRGHGGRERRLHAGRYARRRSRADDLHLGHHGPAQGRAACPPRAARAPAGLRARARVLPPARRPDVDAGGLGLGRWAAQRHAALAALRRDGHRPQVREVRSGGGLPPAGRFRHPQHLRAADGAAHAARRRQPARRAST